MYMLKLNRMTTNSKRFRHFFIFPGKFRREFARAFQCFCPKDTYSPATSRVYTYNIHRRQARQINGGAGNGGRIWC